MICVNRQIFDIADVRIAIDWNGTADPLSSRGLYSNFVMSGDPEVRLTIHRDGPPYVPSHEALVFDSQSHWKLFKTNDTNILVLESPLSVPRCYCTAIFDREFLRGDVYLGGQESGKRILGSDPASIDDTLLQVLTVCLMSRGRGLLVHACGIEHDGRGFLFAGNSGHGKSTMAGLWRSEGLILNDDRIVIRRSHEVTRMYGTPWHGQHKSGIHRSVPVEKCFFLHHAESNEAVHVRGATACAKLLARCFPTLWDKSGMEFMLDFITAVVSEVPCYDLAFVPTQEIVDFVTCLE